MQAIFVRSEVAIESTMILRDAKNESSAFDFVLKSDTMHKQVVGMSHEAKADVEHLSGVHSDRRGSMSPLAVHVRHITLAPVHRQFDRWNQVCDHFETLLGSLDLPGERFPNSAEEMRSEQEGCANESAQHLHRTERVQVKDPSVQLFQSLVLEKRWLLKLVDRNEI